MKKIELSDYCAALDIIVQFVSQIVEDPRATAVIFGSERLDRICLAIGDAVVRNRQKKSISVKEKNNNKHRVVIASHLDQYGGHTRVIKDIIQALPKGKSIILLTDIFNEINVTKLSAQINFDAKVMIAPRGSRLEKLEWLLERLESLHPEQVFMFNHHQDAMSVAAIQPWISPKTIFYHHADHNLCLGVHLPDVIHVDPHNLGYYNCKKHERIKNNRYLPITVQDSKPRPISSKFMCEDFLRTCSSGSHIKFDASYEYPYEYLIPEMLKVRDGTHLHIGDLPDKTLKIIDERLKTNEVNTDRFIHIPWVENLWLSLVENNIDLYISSFPIGGGRATIEAMGSGTPILMHDSYLSKYYGGIDMAYPEAFSWRNPSDFHEKICVITPEILSKHSKLARHHYDNHHHPKVMKSELEQIISGNGTLTPLPLRQSTRDYLQNFLHDRIIDLGLQEQKNIELQEKDEGIEWLRSKLTEKDEGIEWLRSKLTEKDEGIEWLRSRVTEKEERIKILEATLRAFDEKPSGNSSS